MVPENGGNGRLPVATDAASGTFDFRSVLRKTNLIDVNSDHHHQHEQHQPTDIQQVDFRGVLRRKAVS